MVVGPREVRSAPSEPVLLQAGYKILKSIPLVVKFFRKFQLSEKLLSKIGNFVKGDTFSRRL